MVTRSPLFRPRAARTKRERDQDHDSRRGSAHSRGYDGRWAKAALTHRARSPLCRYCELAGKVEAATRVDHLYPWRRFPKLDLFWRTQLWVSSCEPCHNGFKQGVERQGLDALDRLARRLGLPTLADLGLTAGEGVGRSLPPPASRPAG